MSSERDNEKKVVVFAVAGTWNMDPGMREQQTAFLPALVEGVRQNPGFVRGYWSNDVEEPDVSVTFIVFDSWEHARDFQAAVLRNAPAQADSGVERSGLRMVEVQAHA